MTESKWTVFAERNKSRTFKTLVEAKKWARRYTWAQIRDPYGYMRYIMDGNRLKSI